jgi:hypothetical protein
MFMQYVVPALLAATLALAPAAFAQSSAPDLTTIVAEGADTPAEHQALASYYEAKAADARSTAQNHRMMAKHYTGKVTARDSGMGKHCARIAELADQQAVAYEEMAKSHEAAATNQ